MKRTTAQILDRIKILKLDDRLMQEPANVMVNAPLAITQIHLMTELTTLQTVLGLKNSKMPLPKRK